MKKVYGNIEAIVEIKKITQNSIGEDIETWEEYKTLKGWLDLFSGSADYATYNAKIEESTHVFICDYEPLNVEEGRCRLTIANKHYDVTYIDNPMMLCCQTEIFLKYVGD